MITTAQAQAALDEYQREYARGVTPSDYISNGVVDLDRLTTLRRRKLQLLNIMTGLMGNANSIAATVCDAQVDHAGSWRIDPATARVFCVQCVVARKVARTLEVRR